MSSGFGITSLGGALILARLACLMLALLSLARLAGDRMDRSLVFRGSLVSGDVVLLEPSAIFSAGCRLVGVATAVDLSLSSERQSEQQSEK